MHVDRPLHVGVRLRHVHPTPIVSAPQQRLAFASTTLERESRQITRLLLRAAEEGTRKDVQSVVTNRGGELSPYGKHCACAYLAANSAYNVARVRLASFLSFFALVDAPAACEKAPHSDHCGGRIKRLKDFEALLLVMPRFRSLVR